MCPKIIQPLSKVQPQPSNTTALVLHQCKAHTTLTHLSQASCKGKGTGLMWSRLVEHQVSWTQGKRVNFSQPNVKVFCHIISHTKEGWPSSQNTWEQMTHHMNIHESRHNNQTANTHNGIIQWEDNKSMRSCVELSHWLSPLCANNQSEERECTERRGWPTINYTHSLNS